jgi:hypothetical protein
VLKGYSMKAGKYGRYILGFLRYLPHLFVDAFWYWWHMPPLIRKKIAIVFLSIKAVELIIIYFLFDLWYN